MQIETAILLIIEMVVIIITSFSLGYIIGKRKGIKQGIEILKEIKNQIIKN